MEDEIKEIFNKYGKEKYNDEYCLEFETYIIELQELKKIYDYITNLQKSQETLIKNDNEIIINLQKENKKLNDELKRLHDLLNSQAYRDLDNYKSRNENNTID